jgi:site-specific DNA-methyltransferase (adenine-specific)
VMEPYYDDGTCTIYHGDALELLPTMDPASVALVLADPPYGIGLDTRNEARGRNSVSGRRRKIARSIDHAPVHGDDAPFDPAPLLRFRRLVLWGANHYASRLPDSGSWLVWDRQSGDSDTTDAELAWSNLGGAVRTYRHTWNGVCRASEVGSHLHPTQKPVALMAWIIARWTKPGDLILDPYMGSGPVLRAAKDLGRRAIGIEIEQRYCEIAARRLGQEVLAV